MPNTHRRRRRGRDATVELSRVGGVITKMAALDSAEKKLISNVEHKWNKNRMHKSKSAFMANIYRSCIK